MITITMPTWFTILMAIWFVSGFITWILKLVIAETDAKNKEKWREQMRELMGMDDEEVTTDCAWGGADEEEV